MSSTNKTASVSRPIYLRLRKKVYLQAGQPVRLGDFARLSGHTDDVRMLAQLEMGEPLQDTEVRMVDVLDVVHRIRRERPDLAPETYGEPQALLESKTAKKKPKILAVAAAWLLLFTGSGLAIINFHEDVSMSSAHNKIYQLITGEPTNKPYAIQIPYSFGVGFGMLLFFNRLRVRKREEPSPLEVEMLQYQERVDQFRIAEAHRQRSEEEGS